MITGLVAEAADLALEILGGRELLAPRSGGPQAHRALGPATPGRPTAHRDHRGYFRYRPRRRPGPGGRRCGSGAGRPGGPRLDSALAEVHEARDGPGASVRAVPVDLSDLSQAVQLAERLAVLAPIHTLVHNAGALTSTYTRALVAPNRQ